MYDKILRGEYNDVTLRQLDEYISNYTPNNEYGRRISKRIPPRVERKVLKRERANIIDALYTRISESAVRQAERELAEKGSRRTEEETRRAVKETKQRLLKEWAVATGNWHTDISDFTNDKEPFGGGKDSDVYISKDDSSSVVKVSKGKERAKFAPDFDDIALFNYVFPNSRYDIVGYGEIDGKFVRFLKQPIVDFSKNEKELPVEERVDYMSQLGFHPIKKDKTAFSNGTIIASDIQKGNIVKDKSGNVRVIDADMKFHTKKDGGEYVIPPVENDLPKFSLRNRSDNYEERLAAWKERNGLAEDAEQMEKPQQMEGESAMDFMSRIVEWTKDKNLWKTAPKPMGYWEALEEWKQEHGIPAEEFPPTRPRRQDYETEEEYDIAIDQYNREREKWQAPLFLYFC